MGGFGSGRWPREVRKTSCEEAQTLGIGDLPKHLTPGTSGELAWSIDGEEIATVGWRVRGSQPFLVISLYYQSKHQPIHTPIKLQTTTQHFGGHRHWLTCPACYHRVGKLYRPPGQERFACRKCYDLSYRSTQDAHKGERLSLALEKMRERVADLRCRPTKCKV